MQFVELRKSLDIDVKRNAQRAQQKQKKHYDAKHVQGGYNLKQKLC